MAMHTTLQLELPCTKDEMNTWWEEVNRVFSSDAEVNIVQHASGACG